MTMKAETKQQIADALKDFRLPRYNEIPNMGLYLDQATKYVYEYLEPLGEYTLTPSMISNYVKKGLIANPIKKQYGREHIAYLFFIALKKASHSELHSFLLNFFRDLKLNTKPITATPQVNTQT